MNWIADPGNAVPGHYGLYVHRNALLNYQARVASQAPLCLWLLDEALGAVAAADSGSLGVPLVLDPAKTTLGEPPLCAVGTCLEVLNAGANPAVGAHNAAFNFANDFTITALVQVTSPLVEAANVAGHADTNVNFANWGFQITPAGELQLVLYTANAPAAVNLFTTAGAGVTDGLVHHVAGRRSGTDIAIFLDGVLVLAAVFVPAIWASVSPVGVGCGPWSAGADPTLGLLLGKLDAVALWNTALSNAQIRAQFLAINAP